MREKKTQAAGKVTKMLNAVLKNEANSTSCVWVYQPKAPKALDRFKKSEN